ncbi:S8 family peptidase [Actinophytocola sp.]|uniref:S8 family peptidase n=1 Tax=Actinophytocola sp. TaxID=1872138 RepID=UPI002D7E509A|nr:S8 family peptidase [Actinophytocola sp.]HET9143594.1 S8 family peptidase [Actinophytocola sp.]
MGKRSAAVLTVVGLAAVAVPAATQAAPEPAASGYIVTLRTGVPAVLADRFAGRVEHVYDGGFRGFAARLTASEARRLAGDPAVASVEADTGVRALGEQPNPPSWGLDRIDQRNLPLDKLYRYATGAPNVTAYVIDTGVRATHQDLRGRVAGGVDFVDDDNNPDDGNGHGTFIASIIGGTRFGVAKEIRIVPVRVLGNNGAGSIADVIAGVDWVAANARKPAVVNMSLGGSANPALDSAVRAAIASGVTFVVAAGSSASDAGNFSPARVPEAITTAATQINDCVFTPSNFGPLIDLYAPGASITGAWATSDTATSTLSGTSFSTPHVVGGAALYLAGAPTATPAQVATALINRSTKNILCNPRPNTPNRLLYTG